MRPTTTNKRIERSSFRDPSGVVYFENGEIHRQINVSYKENYDFLMESGLYQALVDSHLLIPHREVSAAGALSSRCYKIIRPEQIKYISYPYEWCFEQLKDAALSTLNAQKIAFSHGMSLKDASAYNIQFHNGRPLLIDTLSFERYREGDVWVAYRQFCQHFLAPLALMSLKDIRLNLLLRNHIDGIPLDLASKLLPWRSWLMPSVVMHIHMHARSQARFGAASVSRRRAISTARISAAGFQGIVESLEGVVNRLKWKLPNTEWADYYSSTNYDDISFKHKEELVRKYVERLSPSPNTIQDIGANTGVFSRIAAKENSFAICQDIDPVAVQKNYSRMREKEEKNILPLLMDLTNPSPATGWANSERMSLAERGEVDLLLALALIHHLAISNNLPLERIAEFFSRMGKNAIVEFVPKSDSQVERLLAAREDIFDNYNQVEFEKAFSAYFDILDYAKIDGSERMIYLMARRE